MITALFISNLSRERHDAPQGKERGYSFVRSSRTRQMKKSRMLIKRPD